MPPRKGTKAYEKYQKKLPADMQDPAYVAPVEPDPFWPKGAEPKHLRAEQLAEVDITKFVGVDPWTCKKCGTHLGRSEENPDFCCNCWKTEANNTKLAKSMNSSWMEDSDQLGLAYFERQPEETDIEWQIWVAYRDHYPMKLPTWSELAKETGYTVATVTQAAQRWSFKVRMQSWARYTDDAGAEERIKAIKEMNARQVGMAKTLQEKLKTAIDSLEPSLLRPGEIVQLFKVATELERRVVTATPERVEGTVADTSKKQKQLTKPEDMNEIVAILAKTGMLPGQGMAIEQTTTTRIVAKGEEEGVVVVEQDDI